MRTIIAGSRTIMPDKGMEELKDAIDKSDFHITSVISGGASGADHVGELYAYAQRIPLRVIAAEWDKYGKSAGYKRNEIMADNADALIALWDGKSRGTKHMIDIAKRKNLEIYVQMVPSDVKIEK